VKQQHLLPPEDSGDDEFVLGLGSLDVGHCSSGGESEEPPPEPAPPEIPPRTQSLLMSLRKHSDYKLKYEEKGDQKHEEFIPTSQLQKGEFKTSVLQTIIPIKIMLYVTTQRKY